MSSASFVFNLYLLLSALLTASVDMNREYCFSQQDRLYLITGYAQYKANENNFYNFVIKRQECIFNATPFYHMSLINITNVSNGTFVPTYDVQSLKIAGQTGGKFK